MTKYSIILAFILLLGYTIALKLFTFEREIPLNVQQSKYITAENFLYNNTPVTPFVSLIVGSSMAEKLRPSFLPANTKNLAISGDMSSTGLHLLRKTTQMPKKLYVEMNILTRKEDSIFLNTFGSRDRKLKASLPFLQERNQFLVVLLNALNYFRPINKKRPEVAPQVLAKVQANFENSKNDTSNFAIIRQNINELQALLQDFSNKGVKIYLFRMPIEKSSEAILNSSKRLIFEKNLLEKHLSKIPNLQQIPADSLYNYHTTDGVHLTEEDAKHYANFLLKF